MYLCCIYYIMYVNYTQLIFIRVNSFVSRCTSLYILIYIYIYKCNSVDPSPTHTHTYTHTPTHTPSKYLSDCTLQLIIKKNNKKFTFSSCFHRFLNLDYRLSIVIYILYMYNFNSTCMYVKNRRQSTRRFITLS